MKFLKQGVCLALLGAGLAAVPASLASQAAATPAPGAADRSGLVRDLRGQTDGSLSIDNNPATGEPGFIRASGARADLLPSVAGDSEAKAADKADAFVDQYAGILGVRAGELVRQDVLDTGHGWTVRYTQSYKGVPVFGSMVKANVDGDGDLISVNGYAAPGLDLSVEPLFEASEIADRAVRFVEAQPPTSSEDGKASDVEGLAASRAQLVVYRVGFIKGEPGKTVLAWALEVGNGDVREQLIYDARTGKILNRYSLNAEALDRVLYEARGTTPQDPQLEEVWSEGDPLTGLTQKQQELILSSGESYWFFFNTYGRDSYDDNGATRITVNNDPRVNCPNATWNGISTNYCAGVDSDDIVAHEWGHANTEYMNGLIYQYQSGALNESYSDVWGESLDLINAREDAGETFGTKRADGQCESTGPQKVTMAITAPSSVAGPCFAVGASGAKPLPVTPLTRDVIVATDAANTDGPTTTDGCTTFTNAAGTFTGKWAYVDRGTCNFVVKVANAKAAGAEGIVMGNNNSDVPPGFPGDPALYGVMVSQADGAKFKTAGAGGAPVTVSVSGDDATTRQVSTRWLMGEKADGGASRDMWTPTCHGDPGKVTDAEYKCDPNFTDDGGVHSNSGVPNHAYALAVDGGEYNGQVITGMGLDRAAAIWYQAALAYLVPASNFSDFATALESSCDDLKGQTIKKLSVTQGATPGNAPAVTEAECGNLDKVITAVQLRTAPTKCNFKPILAKNTPSLCGSGFATKSLWSEGFEDGLVDFQSEFEIADGSDGYHRPWTATTSIPSGHTGRAAYGPAGDEGQCDGGTNDFSSRDSLISPLVEVPTGTMTNLTMSFDHYIATEGAVDGGNVKISRNGGSFESVPAAAYRFNAPNGELLTVDDGNTNPMEGELAWSGVDQGEAKGSWGTSLLDLGKAGVKPGDSVRFRFDIGRDGCGGVEGWYVDNIKVVYCEQNAVSSSMKARAKPKVVTRGESFKVKATVAAATGNATGTVEIYKGKKLLGTGTLGPDGKVTIKISKKKAKKLKIGKNELTAKYLGAAPVGATQDDFKVTVEKKKKKKN